MTNLPEGTRVWTEHYRYTEPFSYELFTRKDFEEEFKNDDLHWSAHVKPQGGLTHVKIELPDGRKAEGEAVCSHKDNYYKKLGRQIAIGRALKKLKWYEELATEAKTLFKGMH